MRNKTVDALKGYAIILVVLGHVINNNVNDFQNNRVFEFIYSFHMPLFMFLSGYIIFGTVKKPASKWLWTKVARLVIPFFIWFLIWSLYAQFDFIHFSFINGLSGVRAFLLGGTTDYLITPWFLLVLFIFYCILLVIKYLEKYLGYFAYIWIFLLLYVFPVRNSWLIPLQWYYAFFFIGYLISEHRDKIPVIAAKTKLLICVSSFIGMNFCFPYLIYCPDLSVLSPEQWALKFLTACLGIAASYALISWLCDKGIFQPLSYFGLYTLDIYVLHGMFFSSGLIIYLSLFSRWDPGIYPELIFVTLFALLLSLGISWVIRRSSILKLVLFGSKR